MAYQRIKRITEEERQARAQLKRMGVSEYELERLYDANYKARKRAEFVGAEYGKTLNLNWKNILQGARQARAAGGDVETYIKFKAESYKKKYTVSTIKKETLKGVFALSDPGDWGAELVQKVLQRYSTAEILEKRKKALQAMKRDGLELPKPTSEVYRRSRIRYRQENATTEFEWDNILIEETLKEYEGNKTLMEYLAVELKIDIDGIRARQANVEALGGDSEFIEREKRKAFKEFGPA